MYEERGIKNNLAQVRQYKPEDYNIEVVSLPERQINYKPQRGINFKTAIIGTGIALLLAGGVLYQSHVQHQSMLENTSVEQSVQLPYDATLQVTKNPTFSYIETADGQHVAEYNGMVAEDLAQPYIEEAQSRHK